MHEFICNNRITGTDASLESFAELIEELELTGEIYNGTTLLMRDISFSDVSEGPITVSFASDATQYELLDIVRNWSEVFPELKFESSVYEAPLGFYEGQGFQYNGYDENEITTLHQLEIEDGIVTSMDEREPDVLEVFDQMKHWQWKES